MASSGVMVVVIGWPRCGGGGDCGAGVWCSVVVVWYSSGSVVYVSLAMSVGTKGDEQLTLCTNRPHLPRLPRLLAVSRSHSEDN